MEIKTAERINTVQEYYFSQKLRELERLKKEGKKIINLGIGSPDLPPHPDVIKVLQSESEKKDVHAYQSYRGDYRLRSAISEWYKKWYHVSIDPETEILPLIGSKEGLMHICMAYLNPGDEALVPNPGYPTYAAAVRLAGAGVREYPLKQENQYFPDLNALRKQKTNRVKLMFVNYPHMPTGRTPEMELFKDLIAFAYENNILLVHDNPYSFILNDSPLSLLAVEGAMDVALELNSLSKSHNMAGWRVGMLCGRADRIEAVLRFKSNMDSGMFLPVQLAAARALKLDKNWYDDLNRIYRQRREAVYDMLNKLNCFYDKQQAGLFVWAKVPEGYDDGFRFSDDLLYKKDIFITPGGIFGSEGNHYIRVSLCSHKEIWDEVLMRLS
ncbi:MAG: aminotransferase class I/II-fold pyridoxal phosphate-dependent enzyme [Chitinophagaceae bacterium]|nr:aminotransferase class I/II-fold pyridoxal phosphate-dependent enzyme [Chitinophagaceae bacterium]